MPPPSTQERNLEADQPMTDVSQAENVQTESASEEVEVVEMEVNERRGVLGLVAVATLILSSGSSGDNEPIGVYFTKRRESTGGQAVVQPVGQGTQPETHQAQPTQAESTQAQEEQEQQPEQTLYEAELELVRKNEEERKRSSDAKIERETKRLQQLEQERKEQEEVLAIAEEINRREDQAEREEEEKLSLKAIAELVETSEEEEEEKPKKKKKSTKSPKAPSKKVIQAEKKKMEEFVKRRTLKEEIVGVKLKKSKTSKYPTIWLKRVGDSSATEEYEMVELFKLGFEECAEIYNILISLRPAHYQVVTDDLSKRFKRIMIHDIDTSGLTQPLSPEDVYQAEEEEDAGTSGGRRKRTQGFTLRNLDELMSRADVISKVKQTGYDRVMDNLNLEMPYGVVQPQVGDCIEDPEYGLFILNHRNELGFQRASELHLVPTIHLYALRLVCLQTGERSKNFLEAVLQEGIRRQLDLNQPIPDHVRRDYEESLKFV
jgi:hypothetical protein